MTGGSHPALSLGVLWGWLGQQRLNECFHELERRGIGKQVSNSCGKEPRTKLRAIGNVGDQSNGYSLKICRMN